MSWIWKINLFFGIDKFTMKRHGLIFYASFNALVANSNLIFDWEAILDKKYKYQLVGIL